MSTGYIMPEMISPRETSRRTKIPYEALLQMCHDNKIVHIRSGKNFLINYTWLCEYLNTAGKEE